ncbi:MULTISPECIES: class I SAM-dependent methyltransferase [unclassified Aeromonas]|uniref:class I SAM-dependent methyltransferase n=1 Tax=Aeromonas TaxID=642 RepID=UPI003528162E
MKCRHCNKQLKNFPFLDLGFTPPSNAYLKTHDLNAPEITYPLRLHVCDECWLVQTEDFTDAKSLFKADYAYFSSTSVSWLEHAARYCKKMISEQSLDSKSLVVEIAANDGYLLKNFVAADIPCFGIEPTDCTADAAEKIGIPIIRHFFGSELARHLVAENKSADLLIGNNVLAHVPDINDFCLGMKILLRRDGVITLEFPHVLELLNKIQFDTIYHEHFSYLSLQVVKRILDSVGLRVFNVERLPTHGGSLRIYAGHAEESRCISSEVGKVLAEEEHFGLQSKDIYADFQEKVNNIKNELLGFLLLQKHAGKTVAAYGAAAKGNTLLNYAGIRKDLLPCVYDAAKSKQGLFLPGSHIPIFHPEDLCLSIPDYVLILPWNISDEIINQLDYLREFNTKFITAIPSLRIL